MDAGRLIAEDAGVSGRAQRLFFVCGLVAVLLAFAAGAPAAAAPDAATTVAASESLETALLAELNEVRLAHGLSPLRRSGGLATAASVHSRAMAQFGFFQHESRDGSSFTQRVQRFYGPSGRGWLVGENLLWGTRVNAALAVSMWMQSPPHRRNILTPHWREVGLSAVKATRAPGVFGGRDVVIVTSDFGVRG
jgi:uncharacterized protein YkwD